jgi:hypothetical protein
MDRRAWAYPTPRNRARRQLARRKQRRSSVSDLIYLLIVVGFFALCWAYVRVSDRL